MPQTTLPVRPKEGKHFPGGWKVGVFPTEAAALKAATEYPHVRNACRVTYWHLVPTMCDRFMLIHNAGRLSYPRRWRRHNWPRVDSSIKEN